MLGVLLRKSWGGNQILILYFYMYDYNDAWLECNKTTLMVSKNLIGVYTMQNVSLYNEYYT